MTQTEPKLFCRVHRNRLLQDRELPGVVHVRGSRSISEFKRFAYVRCNFEVRNKGGSILEEAPRQHCFR